MADEYARQIHLFDRELIHEHVSVLHGRAAGIDGVLVLAVYGEDPTSGRKLKFPVERFAIGDVDRIVETIMLYENREHANVYIGLNVMRRDLGAGKRGGTQDLVAVTGLVGDFDEGDGTGESRMPVRPSFVLETSPGNHQCFILFDNPMKPADAALLAKALQAATGADFGTGDVTDVRVSPALRTGRTQRRSCAAGRLLLTKSGFTVSSRGSSTPPRNCARRSHRG